MCPGGLFVQQGAEDTSQHCVRRIPRGVIRLAETMLTAVDDGSRLPPFQVSRAELLPPRLLSKRSTPSVHIRNFMASSSWMVVLWCVRKQHKLASRIHHTWGRCVYWPEPDTPLELTGNRKYVRVFRASTCCTCRAADHEGHDRRPPGSQLSDRVLVSARASATGSA